MKEESKPWEKNLISQERHGQKEGAHLGRELRGLRLGHDVERFLPLLGDLETTLEQNVLGAGKGTDLGHKVLVGCLDLHAPGFSFSFLACQPLEARDTHMTQSASVRRPF